MTNEPTKPSEATVEEDELESHLHAGADRMPTKDEEEAAEEAESQLREDGELSSVEENYRSMTRLGANDKGEGRIP